MAKRALNAAIILAVYDENGAMLWYQGVALL